MNFPDSGIRGLIGRPAAWLESKARAGDVVPSRVRLARNLADERFPARAGDDEQARIRETIREAARAASYLSNSAYWPSEGLSDLDREALVERRLASPAWAREKTGAGVVIDPGQMMALLINEEDHLRLQCLIPGFDLIEAFRMADQLDDQLGRRLGFAFCDRIGFLTACPTNAGTGLRASLLLHLPALALTEQLDAALKTAERQGANLRGPYGEGSETQGNLLQLSNRATLGRTELEIIEQVERTGRQVIEKEQQARAILLDKARHETEDKIWRAYSILANARVLTSDEFINLSSAVRLGLATGVLDRPEPALLSRLLVLTQPAHLQLLLDRTLDARELDVARAELVRREFA
ncbi:MAG: ATP--guanido phosphotransferase [Candidatus Edwardsbacteria bacterium]|nr:ATP--guanido phosphotransferase [Candidatus Edwardsbacteria bacterium]